MCVWIFLIAFLAILAIEIKKIAGKYAPSVLSKISRYYGDGDFSKTKETGKSSQVKRM